ncbi:hypothetical protein SUDANB6_04012 [Streptomyces sp. enrichment culture]|uniref:hypothetical protein n=1 Tax=Streptomyces sp. enrichment culture TaxID=1795815 RepID=UPI003F54AB5C
MGVSRAIRWWPRGRRTVVAGAFAALAAGGVAACDPGGLSSASVAYTTDEAVTRELNRQKAGVRWLTCTASRGDGGTASARPASGRTVASVDCEGETDDGKEITVDGEVTRVVDGACVRGNLTAKVDGKVWFRVDGLGDCDATPTPPAGGPTRGQPAPTVTVTVTRTVWCQEHPKCWPAEGK